MNFLKISGLLFGTLGVAGVSGAAIHYSTKGKNTLDNKNILDNVEVQTEIDLNDQDDDFEIDPAIVHSAQENIETKLVDIKNTSEFTIQTKSDKKAKFDGKIVFYKKTGTGNSATYEVKLMNTTQYDLQKKNFDIGKDDTKKYDKVNKIIDVSWHLNSVQARAKLKEIVERPSLLKDIKINLKSKEQELKALFGDEIYRKLENIN